MGPHARRLPRRQPPLTGYLPYGPYTAGMDDGLTRWLMSDVHGTLPDLLDVPAWVDDAACRGMDTAIFFPPKGHRGPVEVCQGCPVRSDCLDAALEVEGTTGAAHRHGYFGGLSPAQRAHLARQQAA